MQSEAVDFLKKILQIRSINPPGNEREVALELQTLLEAHGIETRRIDFEEGRANLVAWLRGTDTGPDKRTLGLSGHMDVVPPGQVPWTYDPFSATEEDGKIFARGASDMKGGLVGLVFALIALKEEGVTLNGDVKLLASAGEEAGAVGAKQLFSSGHMDNVTALVIAEPTQDDIVVAHKGALWVELTCYGKTAHGSTPELGVNAIVHMNRVMNALLNHFKMTYTPDELLGQPTFNIAVIEGGVKTNVVPDRCSIQIDFRTVPSQSHENIIRELQQMISSLQADDPDLRAELTVFNDLPAIGTRVDDPFVTTVKEAVEELYAIGSTVRGMNGYTDGAALAPPGKSVPFVIIGGGNDRLAHQPDEYIEIDRFLKSIDLYKLIVKKYLAD